MISIKEGVTLQGLRTEMQIALSVVGSIYEKHGYDCIITSGLEGAHSKGSRHYVGLALDFRTRHLREGYEKHIAKEITNALNDEYDVVLEATHLHVEFDPKHKIIS